MSLLGTSNFIFQRKFINFPTPTQARTSRTVQQGGKCVTHRRMGKKNTQKPPKGPNPVKAAFANGTALSEKEAAAKANREAATGRGKRFLRKNGGMVTASGPVQNGSITMKEWQRTPKQLVSEYCQSQKRPRPRCVRLCCPRRADAAAGTTSEPQRPRASTVVGAC